MKPSTAEAGLVMLLNLYVGLHYCAKLIRKQIHPRIVTWLIFEIGVLMSLAAYFSSPHHSILKAALNVTDGFVVTLILLALCLRQTGTKIIFTVNEQVCLAIAGITLAAWVLTKTAWVGFAGFQLVMTVAYLPTLESLWRWQPGRSPEPLGIWSIDALTTLIGVAAALTGGRDVMAMLYPLRAFLLCTTVVILVLRWRAKTRAYSAVPA